MFLTIWVRWHHFADTMSSVEEGGNGRPKPSTHQGIDLRQALALKLTSDFSPTLLRLRKPTRNLCLAGE
jgi:hypothetical protein